MSAPAIAIEVFATWEKTDRELEAWRNRGMITPMSCQT